MDGRHRAALLAAGALLAAPVATLPAAASGSGITTAGISTAGSQVVHPVGGPLLRQVGTVRAAGTRPAPHATAKAYVVADLDTGTVLAARAPHRRLRPASTLKLLLAQVLLPRLDPLAWHLAGPGDASVEGSRVGLVAGVRYQVRELFYGLLLNSGNDAAHALANEAGGVQRTLGLMNAEAARLGALDTRAITPEGLDEPGQLSSAYDLALIGRAVMARPHFLRYSGRRAYPFPGRPRWVPYQIQNQDRLLGQGGVYAGKNGYTRKAGNTYVGAAARGDQRVLVVVLKPDPGTIYRDAAALLDWGLDATAAGVGGGPGVGRLVEPGTVPAALDPPSGQPSSGEPAVDQPGGGPVTTAPAGSALAVRTEAGVAPSSLDLGLGTGAAAVVLLVVRVMRRRRRVPQPVAAESGSPLKR